MYIRKTRILFYLAGVFDRMKTNIANFRATTKRERERLTDGLFQLILVIVLYVYHYNNYSSLEKKFVLF